MTTAREPPIRLDDSAVRLTVKTTEQAIDDISGDNRSNHSVSSPTELQNRGHTRQPMCGPEKRAFETILLCSGRPTVAARFKSHVTGDCAWLECGLFRCTLCASLLSRGALVVRDSPPKIRSIMCRAARRNASILSGRSAASGVFASIVTGTVPHRCISHTDSRSFIDTRKSARHTAVDTVSFRLLPLPGE